MKAFRRAVVIFAVSLAALSAAGPRALAQPNIVGRFNGFCQNNLLPAVQRGPSQFDVTAQRSGRFLATLIIPGDIQPCIFECDGSVFIGGYLTGSGHEAVDGDSIFFAGRTRLLGDGSVRLASMLFAVFSPDGILMKTGILLFVQMQGGPNWMTPGTLEPDASGHWMGDYLPRVGPGGGCIEFDLGQERNRDQLLTSALGGTLHMDNVFLPAVQLPADLVFDGLGTVGLPAVQFGGGAPFGLIGLLQPPPDGSTGNNGIIAILIGLLVPAVQTELPAVQGNYRLYNSLADAFLDVVFERNTSFQGGIFKAPKAPAGGG